MKHLRSRKTIALFSLNHCVCVLFMIDINILQTEALHKMYTEQSELMMLTLPAWVDGCGRADVQDIIFLMYEALLII